MTDIPFIILAFVSAITLILPLIAYIFRTSFPPSFVMWLGGIIWLLIFFATDNITLGYTDERSILTENLITTSNSTSAITHMNTTGQGTGLVAIGTATTIFSGETAGASSSLNGDTYNIVQLDLSRTGSPTGLGYIAQYSTAVAPTSINYHCLIGIVDVSTISTSRTTYEFTKLDGNCQMQAGDSVGLFYNTGSVGNVINFFQSTAGEGDLFDGANSFFSTYGASWTSSSPRDKAMAIALSATEDSIIETPSYETVGNTPIHAIIAITKTSFGEIPLCNLKTSTACWFTIISTWLASFITSGYS